MAEEIKKVWVTTYALTSGVFSIDAVMLQDGMCKYKLPGATYTTYASGKDFYLTEAGAKKRFLELKLKKQESLRKQIDKIAAAEFKVTKH